MAKLNESARTSRRRGAVLVFTVLALSVLLGILGLVIDGGYMYLMRQRAQTAADSSALAAAVNMPSGLQAMRDAANKMAQKNPQGGGAILTTVNPNYGGDSTKVEIVNEMYFQPTFLGFVGHGKLIKITNRAVGQYIPGGTTTVNPWSVGGGLYGGTGVLFSGNGGTASGEGGKDDSGSGSGGSTGTSGSGTGSASSGSGGAGTGSGNSGSNSGDGAKTGDDSGSSKDGSKGNNGVGNGIDPAPPGNPKPNDGAGTGPGNPGNKGGGVASSGSGSGSGSGGSSSCGSGGSGGSSDDGRSSRSESGSDGSGDGSRSDGEHSDGSRSDGSGSDGSRSDGSCSDGSRSDGSRSDGVRTSGCEDRRSSLACVTGSGDDGGHGGPADDDSRCGGGTDESHVSSGSSSSSSGSGSSATLCSVGHVTSGGSVTLSGTGTINGTVSCQGAFTGSCSGKVTGGVLAGGNVTLGGGIAIGKSVTCNGAVAANGATIGGAVTTNACRSTPQVKLPAIDLTAAAASNQNANVPSSCRSSSNPPAVTVGSGASLTLAAGTYYFDSLTLSERSTLTVGSGPVKIFVKNSLSLSPSSTVSNTTQSSNNLQLFVAGTADIVLNNSSVFYGGIYAPNANITISGSGDFHGNLISGKTLTSSGSGTIFVDTTLTSTWQQSSSTPKIVRLIE